LIFEKLPVPDRVISENLYRAQSVGLVAAHAAVLLLEEYTGKDNIFDEAQLAKFRQKFYEDKLLKWLEERIDGNYNDERSRQPGLRALVRSTAAIQTIKENFIDRLANNFNGVNLESIKATKTGEQLYILGMPIGGYSYLRQYHGREVIIFTDMVEMNGFDKVKPLKPIAREVVVNCSDVITIAGEESGEYWQNQNYHIDGRKK
jgi:hypothetical protein